jgi:hypothetical protein
MDKYKTSWSFHSYDSMVKQCYLNLPEDMDEEHPLYLENINKRQEYDELLMQSTVKYPTWYSE